MIPKRKSKLQKLDQFLGGSLARRGIAKAVQSSLVCFWANEILEEYFPKQRRAMAAVSFSNNAIKIVCPDLFWANKIKLREIEILAKLNQKSGKDEVKRLKFEIRENEEIENSE